jgi:hypothetical protein
MSSLTSDPGSSITPTSSTASVPVVPGASDVILNDIYWAVSSTSSTVSPVLPVSTDLFDFNPTTTSVPPAAQSTSSTMISPSPSASSLVEEQAVIASGRKAESSMPDVEIQTTSSPIVSLQTIIVSSNSPSKKPSSRPSASKPADVTL